MSCSLQPLIIVANKCDVKKIGELPEENQVIPFTLQHLKKLRCLCYTNTHPQSSNVELMFSLRCQKIFADLTADGVPVIETSTLTEEGVMQVKTEVRHH